LTKLKPLIQHKGTHISVRTILSKEKNEFKATIIHDGKTYVGKGLTEREATSDVSKQLNLDNAKLS
jgi:hypothetical protein